MGRSEPVVSIVLGTCNRLSRLQRCVEMTRRHVALPVELIVVDGASTDGSGEWLDTQSDLVVIHEPVREGATRAYNKGFRAATGRYVIPTSRLSSPASLTFDRSLAASTSFARVSLRSRLAPPTRARASCSEMPIASSQRRKPSM